MGESRYQIIEPVGLGLGRLYAWSSNAPIAVALFSWLIDELRKELKDELQGVSLSILRVEYAGPYPVIAVHYDVDVPDVGPHIEAAIGRLVQRPVSEFVHYLGRNPPNWVEETRRIMAP